MPFGRRRPLPLSSRLRDALWPRIGLRRLLRLYTHRLHRLPGTPASIAAGFSWGLGISMTPLIGTHMAMSALVARLTGSSILAALLGTLVCNPWTAPPIWIATYYTGRLIEGGGTGGKLPGFVAMFEGLTKAVLSLDLPLFVERVWPVLRPMLIGSIPIGIAGGLASYALLVPILSRLRAHRADRARASAHRRAAKGGSAGH